MLNDTKPNAQSAGTDIIAPDERELSDVEKHIIEHFKCTPRQAALVNVHILQGKPKKAAIEAAGYAHENNGYAAFQSPRVREAMEWAIREHFLDLSVDAVRTMKQLLSAKSDFVRLEAAKDLLDRGGFKPVEKHAHVHGGQVSISIKLD